MEKGVMSGKMLPTRRWKNRASKSAIICDFENFVRTGNA
jgi:hypothetical protein